MCWHRHHVLSSVASLAEAVFIVEVLLQAFGILA
jgi:hypothetical protein